MRSIKIYITGIAFFMLLSSQINAQSNQHGDHSKMEMKKDSVKSESIVRKGVINLKAIDKNKDGKIFQDQMDWNVLADKPGKCPLCKMTLKEVTLDAAKKNLVKNGFKVK